MYDRDGRVYRPALPYQTEEEEVVEDVPTRMQQGWILDRNRYPSHNGHSERVVTRPADYVPYQTYADSNGGYGYDPTGRQYSQTPRDERRSGRVAQRAPDRRRVWNQIRPDPTFHPPGARIDLPLRDGYRNIRPAAPPAGSQAQAAGFMQPGPATRPAGPQLRPLMPAPRQSSTPGPARGSTQGPATRPARPPSQPLRPAPVQGPTPGPTRAPIQSPTQGPTRAPTQGPPLGDQAGVRARGVGSNPRSARGGYGNEYARGNRGGRR